MQGTVRGLKATDCLALETSSDTRPVGHPSSQWFTHQITNTGGPAHEPAPYLSQESDTGQFSQARARGASGSVPRFTGPHCSRKTKPQPQPISKASTEQLPNGGSPGLQITRPAGKTHNAGFPAYYTTTRGPTAAPSKSRYYNSFTRKHTRERILARPHLASNPNPGPNVCVNFFPAHIFDVAPVPHPVPLCCTI